MIILINIGRIAYAAGSSLDRVLSVVRRRKAAQGGARRGDAAGQLRSLARSRH
jgi:hypothetical protein